jgi:hypothetical protein
MGRMENRWFCCAGVTMGCCISYGRAAAMAGSGNGGARAAVWQWVAVTAVSIILGLGGGHLAGTSKVKAVEAQNARLERQIDDLEKARERIELQQAIQKEKLDRLSGDQLAALKGIEAQLSGLQEGLRARR